MLKQRLWHDCASSCCTIFWLRIAFSGVSDQYALLHSSGAAGAAVSASAMMMPNCRATH
ncbi:hypothetical protein [Chromatium okenii]|uniref:hypothetical protein n=1 Tax=Chromatium okenii TaxID=61644 RepID=UPI001904F323|nr:hypothetical protein [Chromatium okenii]